MKHYQKLRIRNFIKLIIFPMIFIFSFFLVGCSNEKSGLDKDTEYEKTEEILGTVIIGKVYGEKSKEALEEAFKRAKNIENIMSAKLSDSELTKVNENAYEKEVKISEDLYFIIEKALYYSNLTEGAFDPTIGKLIDLWGIGTKNERIPEKEEIDLLKGKKNYKNVVINKENSTIRFLDKDIKLDLGAIAKGYAADEMKKIICEKYKIKKGILNLGGNVMTIGSKNENEKWKVGITNPLNIEDVLAVNVAGTTKTYLVAEKDKDLSDKTQVQSTNVTSDGSIVKYDITPEVNISKVYGKTTMNYGDFYYAEVEDGAKTYENSTFAFSEAIENNVEEKSQEGKYDALTSATIVKSSTNKTPKYLKLIGKNVLSTVRLTQEGYDSFYPGSNPDKPNTFPENATFTPVATDKEEGITISAVKNVQVSIDYDTLINALALKEIGKETELSSNFLSKLQEVSDLTTDSSQVGYAKPLYKDGTYGKREIVNKDALNSTVKNAYTKTTYQYGSKGHGEYIAQFYIDGNGMDADAFTTYMQSITGATIKNNTTNEKDGLFFIHNIWGVSGHGLYVEVSVSKTEGKVHYDGKFKDLSVGANSDDYTITLMADGYEDLVVSDINFDKYLDGVTLKKDTFKVSEKKAELEVNTDDVESAFGENLSKEASYTLTKKNGRQSTDCSSFLGESNGKIATIEDLKALVEANGEGEYSLNVKTKDYAEVSLSLIIENDVTEDNNNNNGNEENNGGTEENNKENNGATEENNKENNNGTNNENSSNTTTNNGNSSNITNSGSTTKTSDVNQIAILSILSLASAMVIGFRKKIGSLLK